MPFPSQIWSKTIKYFRWGRGCWCTGRDCPCYMSYIRGVVMIRKQKLHCVISIYNYSLNCDHIVTNSPRVFPKPRKGAEFAPVNSYEPFSQPSLRSSRFLSFFSWRGDFATLSLFPPRSRAFGKGLGNGCYAGYSQPYIELSFFFALLLFIHRTTTLWKDLTHNKL